MNNNADINGMTFLYRLIALKPNARNSHCVLRNIFLQTVFNQKTGDLMKIAFFGSPSWLKEIGVLVGRYVENNRVAVLRYYYVFNTG